jgi:hypothetical protein
VRPGGGCQLVFATRAVSQTRPGDCRAEVQKAMDAAAAADPFAKKRGRAAVSGEGGKGQPKGQPTDQPEDSGTSEDDEEDEIPLKRPTLAKPAAAKPHSTPSVPRTAEASPQELRGMSTPQGNDSPRSNESPPKAATDSGGAKEREQDGMPTSRPPVAKGPAPSGPVSSRPPIARGPSRR